MVQDPELAKAVAAIPQRSERQQDLHKLVGAFVDVGILAQVQNTNNQIVYGRRGTGKTHIFRVLESRLASNTNNIVVYIGERQARSFLLPRELGDHPIIQRLFDLRVLHLVQRGYADKDKPGVRYNMYCLDYGTYVDLLNTSKKPNRGFTFNNVEDQASESHENFVVPFDDKRSTRRIILTQKILEEGSNHLSV